MANFKNCIPFTLEYEGGYCNDKYDKNHDTKYGISLGASNEMHDPMLDVNGDGKINATDIKLLDLNTAIKLYKKHYWDKMDLDDCPSDKVAFIAFDLHVNHGSGGATKIIQRALNECGFNLSVDGGFGPKTKAALFKVNPDAFVKKAIEKREAYYDAIVARRPNQKCFIKGWKNRCKMNLRDAAKLEN